MIIYISAKWEKYYKKMGYTHISATEAVRSKRTCITASKVYYGYYAVRSAGLEILCHPVEC